MAIWIQEKSMKAVFLDAKTLGDDVDLSPIESVTGGLEKYDRTLALRFVAFPTYITRSSLRLKIYTPGFLGRSNFPRSMPILR